MNYQEQLIPNNYYHIYNHAVSQNNLFLSKENYIYFLKKYSYYIHPIAKTYAYCLLPNHFHFLIQIREKPVISSIEGFDKFKSEELFLSKQFSKLFSSYSQAFNKKYNRKGSLFLKNFKRKIVSDSNYLSELIYYIHYNPIYHGISNRITDWEFSSYMSFFNESKTKVSTEKVLQWFGDKDKFVKCHKIKADFSMINEIEYL